MGFAANRKLHRRQRSRCCFTTARWFAPQAPQREVFRAVRRGHRTARHCRHRQNRGRGYSSLKRRRARWRSVSMALSDSPFDLGDAAVTQTLQLAQARPCGSVGSLAARPDLAAGSRSPGSSGWPARPCWAGDETSGLSAGSPMPPGALRPLRGPRRFLRRARLAEGFGSTTHPAAAGCRAR